jgi:hypothetical protein
VILKILSDVECSRATQSDPRPPNPEEGEGHFTFIYDWQYFANPTYLQLETLVAPNNHRF